MFRKINIITKVINPKGEPEAPSISVKEESDRVYRVTLHSHEMELGFIKIAIEDEVIIELMFNETPPDYRYANIGNALHEIALRVCILSGKEKISLGAGYHSLLFHYGCNFRYPNEEDPFPWFKLEDKFINDNVTGIKAYLQWKYHQTFTDEQCERRIINARPWRNEKDRTQKDFYNDVLEFYLMLYKSNKDEKFRESLRTQLVRLGKINLTLPDAVIQMKKKAFNILNKNEKHISISRDILFNYVPCHTGLLEKIFRQVRMK